MHKHLTSIHLRYTYPWYLYWPDIYTPDIYIYIHLTLKYLKPIYTLLTSTYTLHLYTSYLTPYICINLTSIHLTSILLKSKRQKLFGRLLTTTVWINKNWPRDLLFTLMHWHYLLEPWSRHSEILWVISNILVKGNNMLSLYDTAYPSFRSAPGRVVVFCCCEKQKTNARVLLIYPTPVFRTPTL